MKKRLLVLPLLILFTGFVSAAFGYYGSFSLGNFVDTLGTTTIVLATLFIIFFVVLNNVVFIHFFKGDKASSSVVSAGISLLMVYGLYLWDIESILFDFGLSSDLLFTIFSVVFIIAVIWAAIKKRLYLLFTILGLILIILSLTTDLIYKYGWGLGIGIIMFAIGILLWRRRNRKENEKSYYNTGLYPPSTRLEKKFKKYRVKENLITQRENYRATARDYKRKQIERANQRGKKIGTGIGNFFSGKKKNKNPQKSNIYRMGEME